jgi:hypothetical protein
MYVKCAKLIYNLNHLKMQKGYMKKKITYDCIVCTLYFLYWVKNIFFTTLFFKEENG